MTGNNFGMTDFGQWLTDRLTERGATDAVAARGTGIPQSNFNRMRKAGQIPGQEKIRALADFLDIPVLEVLVAAGYLSPEEARLGNKSDSLYLADSGDLLAEIDRRITRLEAQLGEVPPPADVRPLRRVARKSDPRPDDSADL